VYLGTMASPIHLLDSCHARQKEEHKDYSDEHPANAGTGPVAREQMGSFMALSLDRRFHVTWPAKRRTPMHRARFDWASRIASLRSLFFTALQLDPLTVCLARLSPIALLRAL